MIYVEVWGMHRITNGSNLPTKTNGTENVTEKKCDKKCDIFYYKQTVQ